MYQSEAVDEVAGGHGDIMAQSSLYTLEEWQKRPWLRRTAASLLRLGAIWL